MPVIEQAWTLKHEVRLQTPISILPWFSSLPGNFLPLSAVGRWCNGHYNRTPDLGKCGMWWNVWDLARHTILDTKVLDRNVTWLTKHKDTS